MRIIMCMRRLTIMILSFFFDEATSISDLDDPENPFTPDFQDFEVDNFSEEDLKDFYFHYHFSAVSFKFFSRFNKKFKKLS